MQKIKNSHANGVALVVMSAFLWGTIGVATQGIYNVDNTSSLFINLARMLVATPILLFLCWQVLGRRIFAISRSDLPYMMLQGALLAISHAAYFTGIRYAGVTITTLLTVCLSPLIVSSLSVMLGLETLTRRTVLAIGLSLIGSVLLVGLQPASDTQQDLFLGALFSLGAALSYAGSLLCGRFLAKGYHPLQVTAISFCSATVLLLVLNLTNEVVVVSTTQGWLLIVYLGIFPTALAYIVFQSSLRFVTATNASIITLLEPLVATLLAWGLFGETLAITGVLGAGLLLYSIFLLLKEDEVEGVVVGS